MTRDDLLAVCRDLRRELTSAQQHLSEAMRAIAALPDSSFPQPARCPTCGVRLRGPLSLAEHVHNSHGGPVPDAWVRAERMAFDRVRLGEVSNDD